MSTSVRHLPIHGVAARVAELRATELVLFRILGERVTGDAVDGFADPADVTPLATLTNRLAWHVDLLTARLPSIPGVEVDTDEAATARADRVAVEAATAGDVAGAVARVAELAEALRSSVDSTLDPATVRVCTLVLADLPT
jgi:hypothetical protein